MELTANLNNLFLGEFLDEIGALNSNLEYESKFDNAEGEPIAIIFTYANNTNDIKFYHNSQELYEKIRIPNQHARLKKIEAKSISQSHVKVNVRG